VRKGGVQRRDVHRKKESRTRIIKFEILENTESVRRVLNERGECGDDWCQDAVEVGVYVDGRTIVRGNDGATRCVRLVNLRKHAS